MFQSLLSNMGMIIPALIAFNAILGGLASLLGAIGQKNAENIVGKGSKILKGMIDLVQGNLAHK